jgi:hypothetical protein
MSDDAGLERDKLQSPRSRDIGPVSKVTAIVSAGQSTTTRVGGGVGVGGLNDLVGGVSIGTTETALSKQLAPRSSLLRARPSISSGGRSRSNQRGCPRCGARYEIRVHFDRDCALVRGDHFHRVCPKGHRWIERCSTEATTAALVRR